MKFNQTNQNAGDVVNMTTNDWYQDVLDFHKKFGCFVGERPAIPAKGTALLRVALVREEIKEFEDAMQTGDMPQIADAISDAIYVLLGTAISYGIDIRPIWNAVHESNMAKVGGATRDDGKILKPAGWTAPDVAGIIAEQQK